MKGTQLNYNRLNLMSYSVLRTTRWYNRGIAILSVLGFAVTAFLTLAYLNLLPLYCESPIFDCGKIAQHPLAHGLGIPQLAQIPTPVFGLLLFIAMGGLSALKAFADSSRFGRLAIYLQSILTVAALCVFALLSYAEMFIIHAWCLWCVISALIVVGIAVLLVVTHRCERQQPNSGPFHAHVGETACIVGAELCGILVTCLLLWQLRHNPPPQIAPQLTRANLLLADCRVLGNSEAPYTLVELGNYRCPHCKASLTQLNALLRDYRGKLKLIFSPAVRKPDPPFLLLGCAAEAGARQGKYQAMHEALFAHQDALVNCATADAMRAMLLQIAGSLGMHTARFRGDLSDPAVLQHIQQREGVALHYRLFPLPKYVFFTPSHAPVILQSTNQAVAWLHDPRHW